VEELVHEKREVEAATVNKENKKTYGNILRCYSFQVSSPLQMNVQEMRATKDMPILRQSSEIRGATTFLRLPPDENVSGNSATSRKC